jgi:Ca2+-binding RTX toxin-like protein
VLIAGGGQDVLTGNGGKDRLTGGDGRDLFVLGGGKARNYHQKGAADYATITDFDTKLDTLQLDGNASSYVLGAAKGGLGIYAKSGNELDLVAVLSGVSANDFNLGKSAKFA